MEKHRDMEGKGKTMDTNMGEAQDTRASQAFSFEAGNF